MSMIENIRKIAEDIKTNIDTLYKTFDEALKLPKMPQGWHENYLKEQKSLQYLKTKSRIANVRVLQALVKLHSVGADTGERSGLQTGTSNALSTANGKLPSE